MKYACDPDVVAETIAKQKVARRPGSELLAECFRDMTQAYLLAGQRLADPPVLTESELLAERAAFVRYITVPKQAVRWFSFSDETEYQLGENEIHWVAAGMSQK